MVHKGASELRHDLREILLSRTRVSSAGFPYLHRALWARLRDWVPVILDDGQAVLDLTRELAEELGERCAPNARVIRQVVLTAAITAPPDLWLMRHVQSALARAGLADRLLDGEAVLPHDTGLLAREIEIDLRFLLSRGTLVRHGKGYRLADHVAARAFMSLAPTTTDAELSLVWSAARTEGGKRPNEALGAREPLGDTARERGIWHPTAAQIELGAQLVPLVVALESEGQLPSILERGAFEEVFPSPAIDAAARAILMDAGVLDEDASLTEVGRRVLSRGPGPFGIIEAYRQYLKKLDEIWTRGRGEVWVERTANVAASQTANRKTFVRAHDALDAFCEGTGFRYDVFIEHAVGKGEAIRQRAERAQGAQSAQAALTFIGADLEDAAIDAAEAERERGQLPASTRFVRRADIGEPTTLLEGLEGLGVEPDGAVMMVGNGFHEVRDKDDQAMIEVFEGYERAGIVLIFTEESALSVDDLLETAFNTYHAGFRYVHERSGQALRPGAEALASALEGERPLSWAECAERAGYVRAERYCQKSRTVYPYTPPSGVNPSISAEHFFVPKRLAAL